MVRVYERIMLSKAIELLRNPLEALSFVQLYLLGFWMLEVTARRGMDVMTEFFFMHLLRSVLAGEQRNGGHA